MHNSTSSLSVKELENLLTEGRFPITPKSEQKKFIRDPISRDIVVFCPERDQIPANITELQTTLAQTKDKSQSCRICEGKTTKIEGVKRTGQDTFTFYNKNPFPALSRTGIENILPDSSEPTKKLVGENYLLWVSNEHKDIHQLSHKEHQACFELLAELEGELHGTGFVYIFKNTGAEAGASQEHGHYQIEFLNTLPRIIEENKKFAMTFNKSRVAHWLDSTPKELEVKDYENARIIIPPFMKTPWRAIILAKTNHPDKMLNLRGCMEDGGIQDLAAATSDMAYALSLLMPARGFPLSYKLIFHTQHTHLGRTGQMYIEVIPLLQKMGGSEEGGVYFPKDSPQKASERYRRCFDNYIFGREEDSSQPSSNEVFKNCIAPLLN
ncbi:MAG: hypothetical protein ABIH72_05845 [archaeon]